MVSSEPKPQRREMRFTGRRDSDKTGCISAVSDMMVKGQAVARQAVAVKRSVSTRIAAIPCQNAEQAEALLQEFGERGTLH